LNICDPKAVDAGSCSTYSFFFFVFFGGEQLPTTEEDEGDPNFVKISVTSERY